MRRELHEPEKIQADDELNRAIQLLREAGDQVTGVTSLLAAAAADCCFCLSSLVSFFTVSSSSNGTMNSSICNGVCAIYLQVDVDVWMLPVTWSLDLDWVCPPVARITDKCFMGCGATVFMDQVFRISQSCHLLIEMRVSDEGTHT